MHVSYSILFQRLSLGQHGPGLTCDFADETLYILRPVLHYCKYKMLYYCVDIFLTYHVWQFVVCSSSIEYYCCALKWKLGIVLKGFIIIDDGLRPLPCTWFCVIQHRNINNTVHDKWGAVYRAHVFGFIIDSVVLIHISRCDLALQLKGVALAIASSNLEFLALLLPYFF